MFDFKDDILYHCTDSVTRHFGVGRGPILLSHLYCSGTEPTLLECNRYMYGTLQCDHRDDAGVVCQGSSIHL